GPWLTCSGSCSPRWTPSPPVGSGVFGGFQPLLLELGLLLLDRAELGAQLGQPDVVGGVLGQRRGQLVFLGREPVDLALQPGHLLAGGPLHPRAAWRPGAALPGGGPPPPPAPGGPRPPPGGARPPPGRPPPPAPPSRRRRYSSTPP